MEGESFRPLELLQRHPKGALIYYFHKRERLPELTSKLETNFPGRLIVVTPFQTDFFPADLGTQFNNNFYGYTASQMYVRDSIMEKLQIKEEDLEPLLPNLRIGEHIEGGQIVPFANSNIVLFTCPDKDIDRYLRVLTSERKIPKNEPYLLTMLTIFKDLLSTPDAEKPFYGTKHIDLLISGIVGQDRIPILFIDDFFNRAVNRSLSKSFPRVRFIPVAHERVLQGALNIKYLDGKALVTTREIVGEEVINNLEQNGIPIVELGADQFDYYGGPKCRSLDIE